MELESSPQYNLGNSTCEYSIVDEKDAFKVAQEALQYRLFNKSPVPFPEPLESTFTFIDLFAGIGGFRVAMQSLGGMDLTRFDRHIIMSQLERRKLNEGYQIYS